VNLQGQTPESTSASVPMGMGSAEHRPPESVHAETEGVPRRVEEHPEGRTGLVLVPGRAELEHRRLGGVEVVDDHVKMHLLGHLLGRPSRWGVGLHLLERDALTVLRADFSPVEETSTFQSYIAP